MMDKVLHISVAGCLGVGRGPQTSSLSAVKFISFTSCPVFPSKSEGMGLIRFPWYSGVRQLLHPAETSTPS